MNFISILESNHYYLPRIRYKKINILLKDLFP